MAEFLEVLYFSCPLHASGNSHGSRTERKIIVRVAVKAYSILQCFSFPVFSPYPVLARLLWCGCDTVVLCVVALQCLWCSRMAGRWPAHRQAVGRKGERKGGDTGAKLPPPLGTFEHPTTSSHSIFINSEVAFWKVQKKIIKYSGLSLLFKKRLKECMRTNRYTYSIKMWSCGLTSPFLQPFHGPVYLFSALWSCCCVSSAMTPFRPYFPLERGRNQSEGATPLCLAAPEEHSKDHWPADRVLMELAPVCLVLSSIYGLTCLSSLCVFQARAPVGSVTQTPASLCHTA